MAHLDPVWGGWSDLCGFGLYIHTSHRNVETTYPKINTSAYSSSIKMTLIKRYPARLHTAFRGPPMCTKERGNLKTERRRSSSNQRQKESRHRINSTDLNNTQHRGQDRAKYKVSKLEQTTDRQATPKKSWRGCFPSHLSSNEQNHHTDKRQLHRNSSPSHYWQTALNLLLAGGVSSLYSTPPLWRNSLESSTVLCLGEDKEQWYRCHSNAR